jgi:hypothetical protein
VPLTTCRRGAPFLPPNQLPISNLASNSCPDPTQTTTKPILPPPLLPPLPLPEAFLITPTPFNLHNCLPTGGFLQTAVSDAPRTTSPNLPAFLLWGASDTSLAFIVTYPGWYRLLHLGTELNGRVVHSQKLTKTVQRIQSIGGIGYGQALSAKKASFSASRITVNCGVSRPESKIASLRYGRADRLVSL